MKTTSLATLRLEAQQRCDQENTSFIGDEEWNRMINRSADKLHNEIVQIYGADYFIATQVIDVISGTNEYPLPSDFYKLIGVDTNLYAGNDRKRVMYRYSWSDRNIFDNIFVDLYTDDRYRLVGGNLVIRGEPHVQTVTLTYAPVHVNMSDDTDVFEGISGYDDFIVVDCARKAALKEESFELAASLAQELGSILEMIRVGCRNRDADMPFKIQRRRNRSSSIYRYSNNER